MGKIDYKYLLKIRLDNNYRTLLEGSLIEIDDFTTFYKNEEIIRKDLLPKGYLDRSRIVISCVSNYNIKKDIIGSDFRNVLYNYNNENFTKKICEIDKKYLESYFKGLKKKNTIVSKGLESILNAYEQNDDIEYNYQLKEYIKDYEDFRELYTYITGMSLIPREESIYSELDIRRNSIEVEKMKKTVDNMVSKIREEIKSNTKNPQYEETDDDIRLDYWANNSDEVDYAVKISEDPTLEPWEKMDLISRYVDDEEQQKVVVKNIK